MTTTKQRDDLKLVQGTLDALVLTALREQERHGYSVAEWIREQSGETFQVEDGALYTCLHRLERRKWVTSRWGVSDRGRRAKFYRLTALGRRSSSQERDRLLRYARALTRILREPGVDVR